MPLSSAACLAEGAHLQELAWKPLSTSHLHTAAAATGEIWCAASAFHISHQGLSWAHSKLELYGQGSTEHVLSQLLACDEGWV